MTSSNRQSKHTVNVERCRCGSLEDAATVARRIGPRFALRTLACPSCHGWVSNHDGRGEIDRSRQMIRTAHPDNVNQPRYL